MDAKFLWFQLCLLGNPESAKLRGPGLARARYHPLAKNAPIDSPISWSL